MSDGYCKRCGRAKMCAYEPGVAYVVCEHCGTHEDEEVPPVTAAALRKLIEQWRDEADADANHGIGGKWDCANELEYLLTGRAYPSECCHYFEEHG